MGLFDGKKPKAKASDMLARMGSAAQPTRTPAAKGAGSKLAKMGGAQPPRPAPSQAPQRPPQPAPSKPAQRPAQPKPAPRPAQPPTTARPAAPPRVEDRTPSPAPDATAPAAQSISSNRLVEGKSKEIPLDPAIDGLLGGKPAAQPRPEARTGPETAVDAPRPVKVIKKAAPRGPDPETKKRLEELEKRLAGLKDVKDLSEVLSVKYNPFLDIDEDPVFEGKYSAGDLVQAQKRGPKKPLWAQSGYVENWQDDLPPPVGAQAQAAQPQAPAPQPQAPVQQAPMAPQAPSYSGTPNIQIFNGSDGRERRRDDRDDEPEQRERKGPYFEDKPERRVSADEAAERRKAALESEPVIYKQKKAANPRESFLAMHWFTYLSEGTSPSIIFLYLDYYKYVGWIDDETHDWLSKLAEGVASRKKGASWEDFGLDVNKLAGSHMRNLRFIDKLLGTTLQHGEADYLRQTVDMLLMED